MAAITLERLSKRFGDFTALQAMDLEIRDKEFVALLGPSGCGKSTTMNMIAGMEQPSEGRILFDGHDVAGLPIGRRGVGFVFQNYAIFTHMTVRENLAYGLKMRSLPRPEIAARVARIAELLQLGPVLDQPSAGLSVNILQRLAIGRSAAVNPAIFLLDEPLSNVDAAFRAVMRTELKHLQREFSQTMVYVTHDQLEAMTMADRIAVIDRGVLQQVGTPLDVYNHPANVFVARFIGAPGMNLLPGRLVEHDGTVMVDCGAPGLSPALPDDLAAAARRLAAPDVLYGLRPEEIEPADHGLAFAVSVVERIGPRSVVHLSAGEVAMRLVAGSDAGLRVGDRLRLRPRAGSARLFDAASGRAVTGEG